MVVKVAVNGFGTIGKRVAQAITRQKDMTLVGVANRSVNPNVLSMLGQEGSLAKTDFYYSSPEKLKEIEKTGFPVQGSLEELLEKVDVIVDGTPAGVEATNKPLYEKHGVKIIFQGGAEASLAPVSFTAVANYEKALHQPAVRVVSCNTTSLVRTIQALDTNFGVDEIFAVLVRRAVDPANEREGPVDSIVPITKIPSHHGPDVQSVLPHLNIKTMACKVPATLTHVHFVTGALNKNISTEELRKVFLKTGRVILLKKSEGYTGTSVIMERFRDLNRPRDDMSEVVIWEESIKAEGNRVYWIHAVHSEGIVIPENIDAIRAVTGIEKDKMKSMQKTNQSLGIK